MERNAETQDRILDVAIGLWAEKGFEKSTMRELGRRSKIGTSTLYNYFDSKEAIVAYLYERVNAASIDAFEEESADRADERHDLGVDLQRYMAIKIGLLRPYRDVFPALLREAVTPTSEVSAFGITSAPTKRVVCNFLQGLVEQHTSTAEQELAALVNSLWLAHLGVLFYWAHDSSPGQENTNRLVSSVAKMMPILPTILKTEQFGELQSLLLALSADEGGRHGQALSAAATGDGEQETVRNCDIVVIGGGPIGVLYASFLKMRRSSTRVTVIERHETPQHKVGESTLSGFCKALRSVGISHEVQKTLFYPKNGLGFFHIDETTPDVCAADEYVLETFDETFQVERRVLDALVIANARRLGVDVIEGGTVDLEQSTVAEGGSVINYEIGETSFRLGCKWVVDASGPAHMMAARNRLWVTDNLPFQTSAVWGYFDDVRRLDTRGPFENQTMFPRDEYTQHLCFREGWLWYIPQVSWRDAPISSIQRAVDHLLEADKLPTRDQLAAEFALPVTETTSIGLALRSDRDNAIGSDARGTFDAYRRRYKAIDDLLEGASLVPRPHGARQPFEQRVDIRGYAREVVGDGWLAIGDAAFFVDPLISPGLTGGTATAWAAAEATAKALDVDRLDQDAFGGYSGYVRDLHEALEHDNQLVYRSFNHPKLLKMVQQIQEIYAREHFEAHEHEAYSDADLNVWGILDDDYLAKQQLALSILSEGEQTVGLTASPKEQSVQDYEQTVRAFEDAFHDVVSDKADKTPFVANNMAAGRR